jgi:hypothetical protein
VIDSPYVLAGIVLVILAIVVAIVATIVRSRGDKGFTFPSPVPAYAPADAEDAGAASSADLSRLDALLRGTATSSAPSEDHHLESGVVSEPVAYEPAVVESAAVETAAVEPEPEPELEPHAEAAAEPAQIEVPSADIDDVPDREFEPLPGLWHHLIETDDGPLGVQDRLDMVARLEMVGEKWCIDALHSASTEEQDLQVNAAVRAALVRLGG